MYSNETRKIKILVDSDEAKQRKRRSKDTNLECLCRSAHLPCPFFFKISQWLVSSLHAEYVESSSVTIRRLVRSS